MQSVGEGWGWVQEEFGQLRVPDARLGVRFRLMASRTIERGGGRISDVFEDAAERQGAYDLVEGGRVPGAALTASMAAACVERSRGAPWVFVPIDGSSIQVVDRRKKTDLGLVGTYTNNGRGMQVVTALALSAQGTPLGICAQNWWARSPKRRKRGPSTYRPIEERESRHVVQTIRDVQQRCADRLRAMDGHRPWRRRDGDPRRAGTWRRPFHGAGVMEPAPGRRSATHVSA
jgi:hypothetical protein